MELSQYLFYINKITNTDHGIIELFQLAETLKMTYFPHSAMDRDISH